MPQVSARVGAGPGLAQVCMSPKSYSPLFPPAQPLRLKVLVEGTPAAAEELEE